MARRAPHGDLQEGRVENTEDVLRKGMVTRVKLLSIDERGRLRLSRKAAIADEGEDAVSGVEQSSD